MTKPRKTVAVPRRESRAYIAKAREFETSAAAALGDDRFDATMLNAIHAGISAADAACVALAGRRSTDADHARAVDLLEEAGAASSEIADRVRQLRALLGKKNVVEYESRRAGKKEAADAAERASRIVDWADDLVRKAGW